MKRFHIALVRYLSTLWVSGAVALALATWACVLLGLSSATAACVYLVIIVLLSLMDSFVTAVIFPAIAVGCLDFFFIKPLFAFEVANSQDLTTLCAFLTSTDTSWHSPTCKPKYRGTEPKTARETTSVEST